MKKLLSRLVKIGLVLTLLGGIIFVAAFAASDFNFEKMSGIVTTTETYTESDGFTANKLVLDFDTTDIKLNFDENATKISIQYNEKITKKGDTLSYVTPSERDGIITLIETKNWKENLFLWDFKTPTVTVTIPKERVLELVIETDTGDVTITGTGTLNGAEISTDTGDVYATRATLISTKAIKFEADTGDVKLKNLTAAGLDSEMIGIYRVLCFGYCFYGMFKSLIIVLQYFDDQVGACIGSVLFAVLSILLSFITLFLGIESWGSGFLAAAAIVTIYAFLRLRVYLKKLEYRVFCDQQLFVIEEKGIFETMEERFVRHVHSRIAINVA